MSFEYFYGMSQWRKKQLDWLNDDFKVVLVTSDYVASTAHQFLSSVTSGARKGTSANLGTKTVATGTGVCGANPITIASVPVCTLVGLVLYRDTGVEATSELIGYYNGSGFPLVVDNESNITLTWDANGVLQ